MACHCEISLALLHAGISLTFGCRVVSIRVELIRVYEKLPSIATEFSLVTVTRAERALLTGTTSRCCLLIFAENQRPFEADLQDLSLPPSTYDLPLPQAHFLRRSRRLLVLSSHASVPPTLIYQQCLGRIDRFPQTGYLFWTPNCLTSQMCVGAFGPQNRY